MRRVFAASLMLLAGCAPYPHVEKKGDYLELHTRYESDLRERTMFDDHAVPRDGHFLSARSYGSENARQGPAIILMHGFPDNLHLYDLVAPQLAETRHVIAFDFLGWGHSDKPTNHVYSTSSLIRDLDAVVAHFGLDQVVLVAHDASGPAAIDWALGHAERVATLVLLNTFYGPMDTLYRPEAIELFSTPGMKSVLRRFGASISDSSWASGYVEQITKFIGDEKQRDTFVPLLLAQSFDMRPAFFQLNKVLVQEVQQRVAHLPRLKAFQRPVRIIFGADDPYLNVGVARDFRALFPDSELFIIESARHYVQIDQPERVVRLILSVPAGREGAGCR
jgi:pimeloyl-ACP methyl ester carboxylesterase